MGSFSTASEACCACGALQSVTTTPHPYVDYEPGDLFDLDTRTNPLAACGWGACARGVDWGDSAFNPPTEFCSTWGRGPAPAGGRCLSRCHDWPACCQSGRGCDCGEEPRRRELDDFRTLANGTALEELQFFGRSHGFLDSSDDGRACSTTDWGDGTGKTFDVPDPSPSPLPSTDGARSRDYDGLYVSGGEEGLAGQRPHVETGALGRQRRLGRKPLNLVGFPTHSGVAPPPLRLQ